MSQKQLYKSNIVQLELSCLVLHFSADQTYHKSLCNIISEFIYLFSSNTLFIYVPKYC